MPQIVPEITSEYSSYDEAIENVQQMKVELRSFSDVSSNLGKIVIGDYLDESFTDLGWSSFCDFLVELGNDVVITNIYSEELKSKLVSDFSIDSIRLMRNTAPSKSSEFTDEEVVYYCIRN